VLTTDPYQWLEEVGSLRSLEWVAERNASTVSAFQPDPRFAQFLHEAYTLAIHPERIPDTTLHGGEVYEFWRDNAHPRGVWRKTNVSDYRNAEPKWQTLLDVDRLAEKEHEDWVFVGTHCLAPLMERCMIRLSRGGKDAAVLREFDLSRREFVDGGFYVPEAKTSISWWDADRVLLATDFGEGSLTRSGYARTVRLWHRGTSMYCAVVVFAGEVTDVVVTPSIYHRPEGHHEAKGKGGKGSAMRYARSATWAKGDRGPKGGTKGYPKLWQQPYTRR